MTEKRKAPAPPLELALRYDDRLLAVTRALDNLKRTHDGDALTSGAVDAFPLPGLRLAGDAADLPLPLTPLAVDAIARRHGVPRWAGFVDKIVASIRAPLGITDAAQLQVTLKALILVEAGGEFTGGELTVTRKAIKCQEAHRWSPGRTDRDAYDIGYAAFCNSASSVDAAPVTSGHALCLVYDLVTPTVHELPQYAGTQVLQDQVQTALAEFFTVPPPPTKRAKISEDAWRTINEFTTDHRLVYPVMARAFDELQGDEKQLFKQLAAFCDHSNSPYALYLVVLGGCSWDKPRGPETKYKFSLLRPWLRNGHTKALPFASTMVQHRLELGPAGFMERVQHRGQRGSKCADDADDFYRGFHYYIHPGGLCVCTLRQRFALVVQPAALEDVLWGKASTKQLLARLKELQTTSPVEASRLVRRFLANKPKWGDTDDAFAAFLNIVIALNDAPLFGDLLHSAATFEYDDTSLPRAICCFGWKVCVATIESLVERATTTFRSRVHLVCSALHDVTNATHVGRLMHKIVTLLPWAGRRALDCATDLHETERDEHPTVEEFGRLLTLAHQSSLATMELLLDGVHASSFAMQIVVPSLTQLGEGLSRRERAQLSPAVRSLHAMIGASLPVLRNAHYARHRVADHCEKCREIQSFLVSTAQQISITAKNITQRKHIETVVKRQVHQLGTVTVSTASTTTVQLRKQRSGNVFSETADHALESLVALWSTMTDTAEPSPTGLRRPRRPTSKRKPQT